MKAVTCGLALLVGTSIALAAEKPVRFWNLTSETVTSLRLAPAGTRDFGPDLTKGDSDGAVDHDERLAIKSSSRRELTHASVGFRAAAPAAPRALRSRRLLSFRSSEKDLSSCSK